MRRVILLAGLAFFGCDDGETGGAADSAPRVERDMDGCIQGTARCNGANVEICVEGQFADQGPCADGEACSAGVCVPESCDPSCADKVCGPDGCGGVCGECDAGESCDEQGQCKSDCGDGQCGGGETCDTCAEDCGCGDGFSCQGGQCVQFCTPNCEDRTCGADGCGGNCGVCDEGQECTAEGICMDLPDDCGNGICDAGETCSSCAEDCSCDEGFSCQGGQCVAMCVRDCTNRICGPDGCGGDCGECNEDQVCNERGLCADPPPTAATTSVIPRPRAA